MRLAASAGRAVWTDDARSDARFATAQSVVGGEA